MGSSKVIWILSPTPYTASSGGLSAVTTRILGPAFEPHAVGELSTAAEPAAEHERSPALARLASWMPLASRQRLYAVAGSSGCEHRQPTNAGGATLPVPTLVNVMLRVDADVHVPFTLASAARGGVKLKS